METSDFERETREQIEDTLKDAYNSRGVSVVTGKPTLSETELFVTGLPSKFAPEARRLFAEVKHEAAISTVAAKLTRMVMDDLDDEDGIIQALMGR